MTIIRNKLSSVTAGGPRQYTEIRDRFLLVTNTQDELQELRSEIDKLDLESNPLRNATALVAEPQNNIDQVLDKAREIGDDTKAVRDGIQEVSKSVGDTAVIEASENIIKATENTLNVLSQIRPVSIVEFVRTEADFGPENLRIDVQDQPDIDTSTAKEASDNLDKVQSDLGIPEAWTETRGENAIVAIFDTGYAEDLISKSRIKATFSGSDVDDVYAPAEGHGTMTAGAAAANADEGVPFNGAAPDAEVVLVRITDSEGQIRSDIIAQAWDWLSDLDTDKPIIANHSYGTPLCSGRPKAKFCDTAINDVITTIAEDRRITPVYAAGNEAMRCGHRLSGVTSAVTGTNSLSSVITIGALLSNGSEAQRYSSHGRGDCAPIADPKPNVTCRIPKFTYYGDDDGWKIKDVSTGVFGSGGGTSHASPTTSGAIALLQSKAYSNGRSKAVSEVAQDGGIRSGDNILQTEEIKELIERTAVQPRRTQVNSIGILFSERGYDARFGNGEIRINEAIKEV